MYIKFIIKNKPYWIHKIVILGRTSLYEALTVASSPHVSSLRPATAKLSRFEDKLIINVRRPLQINTIGFQCISGMFEVNLLTSLTKEGQKSLKRKRTETERVRSGRVYLLWSHAIYDHET